MDSSSFLEQLRLPPEQVRLALIHPELPCPIPFATAEPEGPADTDGACSEYRGLFSVAFETSPKNWLSGFAVPAEHYRIVEEYQIARERQSDAKDACAAARWERRERAEAAPAPEPQPEDIPPAGKLTPRQAEFCKHYAAQPVAVRAAVLAGYSETSADTYGPRLLKNPLVLDRIAKLRHDGQLQYVVERDTLHDKLEAVFFEALADRNHAAAVAALRMQALLGGLSLRPESRAAPDIDAAAGRAGPKKSGKIGGKSGKVGVRPPKKSGKVHIKASKKSGKVRKSR
jgi:hypothetical protein